MGDFRNYIETEMDPKIRSLVPQAIEIIKCKWTNLEANYSKVATEIQSVLQKNFPQIADAVGRELERMYGKGDQIVGGFGLGEGIFESAEKIPKTVYHASPRKIVGPLRPSPGRMDREATGIYFAFEAEEAARSTPHVLKHTPFGYPIPTKELLEKYVTEWEVNPKNSLDMVSKELEEIYQVARKKGEKTIRKMAADQGVSSEEFDEMLKQTEISSVAGMFKGDRIIPDALTKELLERGYDSLYTVPSAGREGWFVALDPAIVTRNVTQMTPQ